MYVKSNEIRWPDWSETQPSYPDRAHEKQDWHHNAWTWMACREYAVGRLYTRRGCLSVSTEKFKVRYFFLKDLDLISELFIFLFQVHVKKRRGVKILAKVI